MSNLQFMRGIAARCFGNLSSRLRRSAGHAAASAVLLGTGFVIAPIAAHAQWHSVNPATPAAVRFITISNGRLIGGRVGSGIEVWASTNNGVNWNQISTVTSGSNYGDVCIASDGGTLAYCAFRQLIGSNWSVVVCRSTDGGNSWAYDSTVAAPTNGRFVGAPALWFSRDGNIQCYYDSEDAAAAAGHAGSQWIAMAAKPKFGYGQAWTTYSGVASRPSDANTFARDGMSSVVNLGGSDMILVCEGVDPANTSRNALYSVMSHDNGHTWDFTSRQKIWSPVKNGVEFNAYCPMAIRVGGGPVGVAFCTDDDFASPSSSSAAPNTRLAHAKYITTLSTFQTWGNLATIDAGTNTMYCPGLYEKASNSLLCTIDFFNGRQVIDGLN